MLTDVARDDDVIARAGLLGSDAQARGYDADTGGVDEKAVRAAFSDNLGVAGDNRDPGGGGGSAHGVGDGTEHLHLQALFEDESGRQPQRLCPAARQVVDGAVDGEVADVAAREEQGVDHVGVGGQSDPRRPDVQHGGVSRDAAGGTEGRQEEVLDEFLGQDAAAAVAHYDPRGFAQRQRTDPVGRVDGTRHAQTTPADGTGSTPRTPPRWRPWSRRGGFAACSRCRRPDIDWA